MRLKFSLFSLSLLVLAFGFVQHSYAQETARDGYVPKNESFLKYGKFIWGIPNHDRVQVYLNKGDFYHDSQWADDEWKPEYWVKARGGSVKAVLDGLYDSGIIIDQFSRKGVPILEVGKKYIDLSELEKRRVAAFIDYVFGVTKSSKVGFFRIVYEGEIYPLDSYDDERMVGIYTKDGLQLQ